MTKKKIMRWLMKNGFKVTYVGHKKWDMFKDVIPGHWDNGHYKAHHVEGILKMQWVPAQWVPDSYGVHYYSLSLDDMEAICILVAK